MTLTFSLSPGPIHVPFRSSTILTSSPFCRKACIVRPRPPLYPPKPRPRPAFPAAPTARIDRSDEGFVSCAACGSDVLVSLAAFGKRDEVPVTCDNCGRKWRAGRTEVFTLDGAANIVAATAARDEDGTNAFGATANAVKLYVGGLGPKVTKADLKLLFEDYGTVTEAVVVFDRVTGRSRGFGFVSMAGESAADAAMSDLHQSSKLGGRRMSVRLAEERR